MFGLILQVAATYAVWRLLRQIYSRRTLDNIPGPPSASFLTGNLSQLFSSSAWDFHEDIAARYGSVIKVNTLLGGKQLYLFDPKVMHHILFKDQDLYEEGTVFFDTNKLLFGEGLLSTAGDHHRKQRKMLNPVFSTTHMRDMLPTFYVVGHKLRAAFHTRLSEGPKEIDVLQWTARTALELVGQAGLGHSFDSMTEDTTSSYIKLVKEMVPSLTRISIAHLYILPWAVKIGSPRFRRFVVDLLPWKDLHTLRDATDVMHATSLKVYKAKKQALEAGDEATWNQIGQGRDIISILMKANTEASDGERLSESEIIAQMTTLTFAATDTTSCALARTLHLLAMHPGVQDKLRAEVTEARLKAGGDLPYDKLISLPYLDAVCRETLRLHPPLSLMMRAPRDDAVLPLSKPIKGVDGTEMHEILVPKNTHITLSLIGSNRDPELWGADSHEWKPERWLSPLPDQLTDAHIPAVYSHMMTFLGGGRSCIGFKFAELEMKVVISLLVDSFRISLPGPEKEVVWRMSFIVAPAVKGGTGNSELPLVFSLVDSPRNEARTR